MGEGLRFTPTFEARIDAGPGYRIHYATDDDEVVLLCGGDKKTQISISKTLKGF
jgi:putative addiction module killer protein